MNNRLKEFFNFKKNLVKAITTLVFLLGLNGVFWWKVWEIVSYSITSTTIIAASIAILEVFVTVIVLSVKKNKDESMSAYLLKVKTPALIGVGILYFILMPLIAVFYFIIDQIIQGVGNNSILLTITIWISRVLLIVAILWITNYAYINLIKQERQEPRSQGKKEQERLIKEEERSKLSILEQVFNEEKVDLILKDKEKNK